MKNRQDTNLLRLKLAFGIVVIIFIVEMIIAILLCSEPVKVKAASRYSDEELVAKVIYLENGDGSLKCRALTGIALVNRAKYCPWCPDDIYGCIMQKAGPYWQYAASTRNGLDSAPVTKSNLRIARKALRGGYKTPHNMIYQGMRLNGEFYYRSGTEYFGLDPDGKDW